MIDEIKTPSKVGQIATKINQSRIECVGFNVPLDT